VPWSDETWVTSGRHTRTWVTWRPEEEYYTTCIVERMQRKRGWMVSGTFHSSRKGPCLFWEKDWGRINADTYCEHVVSMVRAYFTTQNGLLLMQDGTPGRRAQQTLNQLTQHGIPVMAWPPYPPDLVPIESMWDKLKEYISTYHQEYVTNYELLRTIVYDAWQFVDAGFLEKQLNSMKGVKQSYRQMERIRGSKFSSSDCNLQLL
jgi:transposase